MSKLIRRSRSGLLCGLAVLALSVVSPSTVHAAGLLAPTDQTLPPLRVTDHLVDVKIVNGLAVTNVTQTFRNDTKQRLEATYLFPLPEDADLTDFQMTFNGKMVKGQVLPAKEAARIYESIVRQLKDPGLIEFIGRRLLKMRIFPIEPESETTIKLRYQQICRPISGMMGYHYPLRTRKTAGQAYGTVRFTVDLGTAVPLKSIWSPTHAVEVVRGSDERSARIAYEASQGSLEDDFVLLYATDESDVGLSVVAHKPGEEKPGHFVLMLTPRQLWPDSDDQPQDVVFVIDTSGSMAGDKLTQAKAALKYCIDRLDDRDRFSVVRFSTGFDALFDEPTKATPRRPAGGSISSRPPAARTSATRCDTCSRCGRRRWTRRGPTSWCSSPTAAGTARRRRSSVRWARRRTAFASSPSAWAMTSTPFCSIASPVITRGGRGTCSPVRTSSWCSAISSA